MNLCNGFPTKVTVQFHEVDSMNIVHHSYYIYWMEIARFHFARTMMGLSFQDFHKLNFSLPVTKLDSKYSRSALLGQEIIIYLKLVEQEKAIVTFIYEMREKETDKKLFEGRTEHAFINDSGKLLLQYPEQWTRAVEELKKKNTSYIITNEVHV